MFVCFAKSNLHYVLLEPLISVMREFGGVAVSGGSSGSWKGLRWCGFDDGSGRKRRVNQKSQFRFSGSTEISSDSLVPLLRAPCTPIGNETYALWEKREALLCIESTSNFVHRDRIYHDQALE
ncbi:unnamed protein product [Lactuca saligna]|uniref:Uncharacterized protein n=1 Tax=Lactuca saligna TaxID=75948 RepID=A0AA36EPK0_LACSI|nr:unnamed protein product [Lactuca saligna]